MSYAGRYLAILLGFLAFALQANAQALPDGALLRLGTNHWRHGGKVYQVGFIDNKTLLSCGEDHVIRVWEVPTGKHLRQMQGGWMQTFELSADRETLVGFGDGANLTLFEIATGRVLRQFKTSGRPFVLSRNGNYLAVARSYDVQIWELEENKAKHELKTSSPCLVFSTDNKLLATAEQEKIHLWSVDDGSRVATLTGHTERLTAFAFSPSDPNILVSCAQDQTVRWWDVAARKEIGQVKLRWVSGIGISPDGKTLAASGHQIHEGIHLYDMATREMRRRLSTGPENTGPGNFSFSPDGKLLASSSGTSVVHVYDIETGKRINQDEEHRRRLWLLSMSPDGKRLATAGYDSFVHLWEMPSGKKLHRLPLESEVYLTEFTDKGKTLATLDFRKWSYKTWDAETGKLKATVRMPGLTCWGPALSPDGKTLALSDFNQQKLGFADTASGELRQKMDLKEGEGAGQRMRWSPDGRHIATTIAVLDAKTGKVLHRTKDYVGMSFAFDDKGDRLAWAMYQGLHVLDLNTGADTFHRDARSGQRGSVAFSHDGKQIGVGWYDGKIEIVDAATGKVLRQFSGHHGAAEGLVFTPDDRALCSSGADSTVLVWDLRAK